jgi:hypothetical protein
MLPGRRDRAIADALGGTFDISHLAVPFLFYHQKRFCESIHDSESYAPLAPGRIFCPSFLLCAFCWGLAHYSYRAKELLVCWLFFCPFFALLAVLFLGSALASYASSSTSDLHIPDPRIPAAGTFKLSADTYATMDALDSDVSLSIEVPPSAVNEQNV